MTTNPKTPEAWANRFSLILKHLPDELRFPVDVERLALEMTLQLFPADPVTKVRARSLEGFEGALVRGPRDGTGWGIAYSDQIGSPGRQRFTVAHELGHYLLHREKYPDGFQCRAEDLARWDSEYNRVEQEANLFASTLLMPLDDYRALVGPKARPTIDDLGRCASRYGVSLTAAVLKWLSYTERRAVLVVSRDGYILWAWSSDAALKSGRFFRTRGRQPIAVPAASPASGGVSLDGSNVTVEHLAGVWFPEPVVEHLLVSDRFDFGISLLHMAGVASPHFDEGDDPEDVVEHIGRGFLGHP